MSICLIKFSVMLDQIKNLIFGPSVDYKSMLEKGAIIVDVRSPQEFATGHINGSSNIPLPQLSKQISQLKQTGKPIITCCASGMRSANAASQLKNAGIEAVNGGGWHSLAMKLK